MRSPRSRTRYGRAVQSPLPAPDAGLRPVQRIAAYGIARRDSEVLLVRAAAHVRLAGRWALPGGGVRHGEHPREALVREVAEETGLQVVVGPVQGVLADVVDQSFRGLLVHTVRLLYDIDVPDPGASLRPEVDGTTDHASWVDLADASSLPLRPFAARALGLPPAPEDPLPNGGLPTAARGGTRRAPTADADVPVQVQRAGVYVLVTQVDRVLLTRLAAPPHRWTLPGGGLEHGEDVLDGLRREVWEETGLVVSTTRLLDVGSQHYTGRAPHGRIEDYHAVRILFEGSVAPGSTPRVVEVGGTTDAAAWVPRSDLGGLDLSGLARDALALR